MPGQWTSIETNFPTFTGNEKVEDKLAALHNYMHILTQQLKYNLSNLGAENWNTSALRQLTKDTSDEVAAAIASELESIAKRYEQLNANISALTGRMNGAEGEIARLEERTDQLEGNVKSAQEDISWLDEAITGEGGLAKRMEHAEGAVEDLQVQSDELAQATEELKGAVAVAESSVTIGGEGKELRLVGRIYINGILFEPQENTEQEGTE